MALTDTKTFADWKNQAKPGKELVDVYRVLSRHPNADEIIGMAYSHNWNAKRLMEELQKNAPKQEDYRPAPQGDTGGRAAVIQKARGQAATGLGGPVSPVFANKPLTNDDGQVQEAPQGAPQSGPQGRLQELRDKRAAAKAKKSGGPLSIFKKKGSAPGPARPVGRGGGKSSPVMILVIVAVLLVLGGGGYYAYSSGLIGGGSDSPFGEPFDSAPSDPQAPADQNLSNMTAEEKALWAQSVVDRSTSSDSFKNKPASIGEFFSNFANHLNWLLTIAVIPFLMVSIYRERTQMGEISDVTLSNIGFGIMLIAVWVATGVGNWAVTAGWSAMPVVFKTVVLVVGFVLNMVFQGIAWYTGENDLSVVAFGIYSSGTLLKWWFPADMLLTTIGTVLVVLGIIVQILEVRRHKVPWRTAVLVLIMLAIFFGAYVGMYDLFQGKLDSFTITVDPTEQTAAALQISVMSKWQMGVSLLVGFLAAYFGGMIIGMILLKATGSDAHYSGKDRKVMDADATSLAIMILFLILPFIWKLPEFLKLLGTI